MPLFLKSHPHMKDVFWWFLRSTFMAKSKKEQEKKVHWEERIKSKWKHKDQTGVEYFTRQDGSEAVAKSWSEIWVNSNKNSKQTNKGRFKLLQLFLFHSHSPFWIENSRLFFKGITSIYNSWKFRPTSLLGG